MSEVEQLKAQLEHVTKLYKKLQDEVLRVVPYVQATVSPGNRFASKDLNRRDWVEVHLGRADQSYHMLRDLEAKAKEPD